MDFEFSVAKTGRKRVDIQFDDNDLSDLRRAEENDGREAVMAMARGAGMLLREQGVTGTALIVSPLCGYGFKLETCYDFLGTLRSVPGLEIERAG